MPAKRTSQGDGAPLTSASIKRQYERPPSFTDLLPWMEYIPESKAFLLEDGISMGALFDITPIGCEARTPEFMSQLRGCDSRSPSTNPFLSGMKRPGCYRSMCRMSLDCIVLIYRWNTIRRQRFAHPTIHSITRL